MKQASAPWVCLAFALACLSGCGDPASPGVTPAEPVATANNPGKGPANVPANAATHPVRPASASPYVFGYVGAAFGDLSPEGAKELGLTDGAGAAVVAVTPGGAAAEAGVRVKDVVRSVDGTAVANTGQLIGLLRASPGVRLRLAVVRDKSSLDLDLAVRQRSIPEDCRKLQTSAAAWIVKQQLPSGAWPSVSREVVQADVRPSISLSALSLAALSGMPADARAPHAAALERAVGYVVGHLQEDGGLLDPEEESSVIFRNFATSFAIQGLATLDRAKHQKEIDRMVGFLLKRQIQENNGFEAQNWEYGGWNYYEDMRRFSFRTDLIGLALVVRGLAAASVDPANPCFGRARRFVERSQNLVSEEEATPYHDGGFAFNARISKAGEERLSQNRVVFRSYGSTTCDGLASLLHLGAAPADPRVQAAFRWIQTHFTVQENPGFRPNAPVPYQRGIYYYYLYALSDALSSLGQETVAPPGGAPVYWVRELVDQLVDMQRADGSWMNELNIMSEDDPLVATALSLQSLNSAAKFLR